MTHVPDELVTTYLEMTQPAQFKPALVDDPALRLLALTASDVPYYRFLYDAVGGIWRWRDRRLMTDEALAALLAVNETQVLYTDGAPAGYVELSPDVPFEGVEIVLFGLRPAFVGRGLGKHLLSVGIQRAWEKARSATGRVWVHTCNLDSPVALDNYQKRGFVIYDVRREPMPERYRD
jgi:GNAT superfamily N-acetyltransferase